MDLQSVLRFTPIGAEVRVCISIYLSSSYISFYHYQYTICNNKKKSLECFCLYCQMHE